MHEQLIVHAPLSGIRRGQQIATRRRHHLGSARQPHQRRSLRHLAEVASAARSGGWVPSPPRDARCGTSLGRLWTSCLQFCGNPKGLDEWGVCAGSRTTQIRDVLGSLARDLAGQEKPPTCHRSRRVCRRQQRRVLRCGSQVPPPACRPRRRQHRRGRLLGVPLAWVKVRRDQWPDGPRPPRHLRQGPWPGHEFQGTDPADSFEAWRDRTTRP